MNEDNELATLIAEEDCKDYGGALGLLFLFADTHRIEQQNASADMVIRGAANVVRVLRKCIANGTTPPDVDELNLNAAQFGILARALEFAGLDEDDHPAIEKAAVDLLSFVDSLSNSDATAPAIMG